MRPNRIDINLQLLIEEYKPGVRIEELLKKYHCRSSTLYRRIKEAGIILNRKKRQKEPKHLTGEKSPHWKGGRRKNLKGYVMIRLGQNDPRSNSAGEVREHLIIWEKFHNKSLPKGYLIHHLNGIKDDNRPQNLIAMKVGEHSNQTEPFKKRIRELEIEIQGLKQGNLFK